MITPLPITKSLKIFSRILAVLLLQLANANGQTNKGLIKGQVYTSEGKPADNVAVMLKEVSSGTSTDDHGNFELRAEAGNYTLIVSQTGAERQSIAVHIAAGQITHLPVIRLNINNKALQEVTISSGRTNKFTRKQSEYITKMPLSNLENPQVYTSISKELLRDQQINNLDDALKNAPGVTKLLDATGRAGSGATNFVVRGFATQARLRNGLAGNITTMADAVNVEAIEVVKGPSATLFGNTLTSYGGLINRVTKKAFKATAGEVSYYGGSYGLNRISADYNTPLDTAGKVLFRINAAYNYQNSFTDNGYRKSLFIAPTLSYRASDRLDFTLDAEFNSMQSGGSQYFYLYPSVNVSAFGTNRADEIPLNYRSTFSNNDVSKTGQNANVFGQMNYKISSQWKSQTNFSVTTSNSKGPAPYFYIIPGSTVRTLTGVNTYTDPLYMERMVWSPNGNDLNAELQENVTGDFKVAGIRNRLTIGLDYYHAKTNINFNRFAYVTSRTPSTRLNDVFDFISISNPGNSYYNFNEAKVDSAYANRPAGTVLNTKVDSYTYSAYAADVINITDNLIALLSLRVDRFDNKGILNNATNVKPAGYHQVALAPKFGLVYQILPEKLSVFGNYQSGFTNKTGTDFENNAFKPEHANQTEGGVKYDLMGGRVSGTVSYYHIKVGDIIRPYEGNTALSIQDGDQVSEGVEAEVVANPFAGFNVIAGYGYNYSVYTKTTTAQTGLRPTNAGPERSANLWMSYRLSNGPVKGLGFGAGGNYAGKVYAINSNTYGQFILPSYTIYNAAIFYDQSKYRIGLKMNNIADKKYWVGSGTMNPQMLREIVANLTFRF
jgi:iron complex outermembrane receptor protein